MININGYSTERLKAALDYIHIIQDALVLEESNGRELSTEEVLTIIQSYGMNLETQATLSMIMISCLIRDLAYGDDIHPLEFVSRVVELIEADCNTMAKEHMH